MTNTVQGPLVNHIQGAIKLLLLILVSLKKRCHVGTCCVLQCQNLCKLSIERTCLKLPIINITFAATDPNQSHDNINHTIILKRLKRQNHTAHLQDVRNPAGSNAATRLSTPLPFLRVSHHFLASCVSILSDCHLVLAAAAVHLLWI